MKQGNNISMPLNGIVRNQSLNNATDGDLDEIINLRFRDNHWEVCGNLKEIGGDSLTEYMNKQCYIHVTDRYKHIITLAPHSGTLYWIANLINEESTGEELVEKLPMETIVCQLDKNTDKYEVSQNGNLLSIVDGFSVKYALYDETENAYTQIDADLNGTIDALRLNPEGLINFRVTPYEQTYTYTDKAGVSYERTRPLAGYTAVNVDYSGYYNANLQPYINFDYDKGLINDFCRKSLPGIHKAYNEAQKSNFFTGYFLVRYALRMYDGKYTMPSPPLLMCPPYITKKENREYDKDDGKSIYVGNIDKYNPAKYDEKEIFGSVYHAINYSLDDIFSTTQGNIAPSEAYDKSSHMRCRYTHIETQNQSYNPSMGYGFLIDHKPYNPLIAINDLSANSRVFVALLLNKLQISISDTFNENFKDIIKSIDIFVTEEINPYNLNELGQGWTMSANKDYHRTGDRKHILQGMMYEAYPPYKAEEDIIKEIDSLAGFYKVASISTDRLGENKNGWIDVRLDDGALGTLTERERLPLNIGNGRQPIIAKKSLMYNGRLHLADVKNYPFRGFPLPYYNYFETDGQFPESKFNYLGNTPYTTIVKSALANGQNKEDVVLRKHTYDKMYFTNETPHDLNPFISSPFINAKYIDVITYRDSLVYPISDGRLTIENPITDKKLLPHKQTFKLKEHPYLDFSYYVSPNLKPIPIARDFVNLPPSIGVDFNKHNVTDADVNLKEVYREDRKSNIIKVSNVDNPFYFPYENTYSVGDSRIIGMATNTLAVSTGQVGDAPLYVFTQDGVYALFVDPQGELAYPSARPLSRDICINADSITPTDLGVAFITERGLMMIQGSEVIDLTDKIERNWFNIETIKEVAKCLDNEQLVRLKEKVTNEDIYSYLKDALVSYNYFERELWISNPTKQYSYVLREGKWSKRTDVIKQFLTCGMQQYAITQKTSLSNPSKFVSLRTETTKDASANDLYKDTMFLTRPMIFGTQQFKQNYRTILRSILKTDIGKVAGFYLFGSYDCEKWALLGAKEERGSIHDLGLLAHRLDCKFFRLLFVGNLNVAKSSIEYIDMSLANNLLKGKLR